MHRRVQYSHDKFDSKTSSRIRQLTSKNKLEDLKQAKIFFNFFNFFENATKHAIYTYEIVSPLNHTPYLKVSCPQAIKIITRVRRRKLTIKLLEEAWWGAVVARWIEVLPHIRHKVFRCVPPLVLLLPPFKTWSWNLCRVGRIWLASALASARFTVKTPLSPFSSRVSAPKGQLRHKASAQLLFFASFLSLLPEPRYRSLTFGRGLGTGPLLPSLLLRLVSGCSGTSFFTSAVASAEASHGSSLVICLLLP